MKIAYFCLKRSKYGLLPNEGWRPWNHHFCRYFSLVRGIKSQMTIQLWAQGDLEHSSVFSLSIDSMLQGVYGLFNDRVYRFILTISLSYVFSFSQCWNKCPRFVILSYLSHFMPPFFLFNATLIFCPILS